MSFPEIPSSELFLEELLDEQQEFVAGGAIVYKEEYHYEEKTEHSSEEKTGDKDKKENSTFPASPLTFNLWPRVAPLRIRF